MSRSRQEGQKLIKGELGWYVGEHVGYIGEKPPELKRIESLPITKQVDPNEYLNQLDVSEYRATVLEAFDCLRAVAHDPRSKWTGLDYYKRRYGEFINITQLWLEGDLIWEHVTIYTHPNQSLIEAATNRVPQVLTDKVFTGNSRDISKSTVYTEESRSALSRIWEVLNKDLKLQIPALKKEVDPWGDTFDPRDRS